MRECPPNMSQVMCHVSHVTIFLTFFLTNWWSLAVEGLLSTGPNPSIFFFVFFFFFWHKVAELVRVRVCYQWSLLHLVFNGSFRNSRGKWLYLNVSCNLCIENTNWFKSSLESNIEWKARKISNQLSNQI